MNFLDLVAGGLDSHESNQMDPLPVVPPPSAQASPAASSAPNIMDLLSRAVAPQATPQAPKPNIDALPGLALLEFAARVAQPRARGQSTVGKFAEAAAGSVNSYMANKRQEEDLAIKRQQEMKHSMLQDEQIRTARLSSAAKAQDIARTEEQRPKELQALEAKIQGQLSDNESKAVATRLLKVKEKYAEQMAQAELDERAATTADKKAQAAMRYQQAAYHKRHAELLEREIDAKKRSPGQATRSFQEERGGLPGQPTYILDQTTGRRYLKPMGAAEALAYAKEEVEALAQINPEKYKGRQEKESAIRAAAQRYMKGDVLPSDGGPAAPSGEAPAAQSAPSAPAAASGKENYEPEMQQALAATAKSGKGVVYQDKAGQKYYIIAGKVVPESEYNDRKTKAAAAAAPADTTSRQREPGQFNGVTIPK